MGCFGATSRFIHFCGNACAPVQEDGSVRDKDAWDVSTCTDSTAPGRVLRFLSGIRKGEQKQVDWNGKPVSKDYMCNFRGYLAWLLALTKAALYKEEDVFQTCRGLEDKYVPMNPMAAISDQRYSG